MSRTRRYSFEGDDTSYIAFLENRLAQLGDIVISEAELPSPNTDNEIRLPSPSTYNQSPSTINNHASHSRDDHHHQGGHELRIFEYEPNNIRDSKPSESNAKKRMLRDIDKILSKLPESSDWHKHADEKWHLFLLLNLLPSEDSPGYWPRDSFKNAPAPSDITSVMKNLSEVMKAQRNLNHIVTSVQALVLLSLGLVASKLDHEALACQALQSYFGDIDSRTARKYFYGAKWANCVIANMLSTTRWGLKAWDIFVLTDTSISKLARMAEYEDSLTCLIEGLKSHPVDSNMNMDTCIPLAIPVIVKKLLGDIVSMQFVCESLDYDTELILRYETLVNEDLQKIRRMSERPSSCDSECSLGDTQTVTSEISTTSRISNRNSRSFPFSSSVGSAPSDEVNCMTPGVFDFEAESQYGHHSTKKLPRSKERPDLDSDPPPQAGSGLQAQMSPAASPLLTESLDTQPPKKRKNKEETFGNSSKRQRGNPSISREDGDIQTPTPRSSACSSSSESPPSPDIEGQFTEYQARTLKPAANSLSRQSDAVIGESWSSQSDKCASPYVGISSVHLSGSINHQGIDLESYQFTSATPQQSLPRNESFRNSNGTSHDINAEFLMTPSPGYEMEETRNDDSFEALSLLPNPAPLPTDLAARYGWAIDDFLQQGYAPNGLDIPLPTDLAARYGWAIDDFLQQGYAPNGLDIPLPTDLAARYGWAIDDFLQQGYAPNSLDTPLPIDWWQRYGWAIDDVLQQSYALNSLDIPLPTNSGPRYGWAIDEFLQQGYTPNSLEIPLPTDLGPRLGDR